MQLSIILFFTYRLIKNQNIGIYKPNIVFYKLNIVFGVKIYKKNDDIYCERKEKRICKNFHVTVGMSSRRRSKQIQHLIFMEIQLETLIMF